MKIHSIAIPALLLSSAALAQTTFQCPSPGSVTQHTIPSSVNCAYTAESDGIQFGGYNNCDLAGLPFVGGTIGSVNGYWSINCGYSNGASGNTMSVGPDPVISHCHFANGTDNCKGTLEQCAITCPTAPSIAGAAG